MIIVISIIIVVVVVIITLLLYFVVHSSEFDTPLGSSGPASPAPSPVPDIDYTVPDTGSIKEVGFYLLRKDSERRSTLVRIMTEDQDAVSADVLCLCR